MGMQTRNRARTPEFVPTPGVLPVPTSPSRDPRTGVNRSQPPQREVLNAEFRQSIHTIAQLVTSQTRRSEDVVLCWVHLRLTGLVNS